MCLIAWNEPIGRPNWTPHLGVLDGHLEHLLGAADLLGGEADGDEVEHPRQHVPAVALGPDQPGRRVVELELGLLAGLVHRRQRRAGEARGVAVDGEQADAGGVRAATMIRSAVWPSSTNIFVPVSV